MKKQIIMGSMSTANQSKKSRAPRASFSVMIFACLLTVAHMAFAMQNQQVTIRTQDGKEFNVDIKYAKLSGTITELLKDVGVGDVIPLHSISSKTWNLIQQQFEQLYLIEKSNPKKVQSRRDMKAAGMDILARLVLLDGQTFIELIAAANYLNIPHLLRLAIDLAKGRNVKKILPEQIAVLPKEIRNSIILAQVQCILEPLPVKELAKLMWFRSIIDSVCVTPDSSKIVAGFADGTIGIWDAQSQQELAVLEGHTGNVTSVSVTLDGSRIVSGSKDDTIRIWDLKNHNELAVLRGHSIFSVCVTPDSSKIVYGSGDNTIRIWDLESSKELAVLKGHTSTVTSVCVTPDGNKIVSGSKDETIRIWDLERFNELAVLKGHTRAVTSVCVTPESNKIVSGSKDKTIRLWDLDRHTQLVVLKGHTGAVASVCVTPDGSKIVSGSDDDTVRIWDLESFQQLAELQEHADTVFSVCVTPDGNKIVSASYDGTIRIWDASLLRLLPMIKAASSEQAQQLWRYLQSECVMGWDGIVDILKQPKKGN